MIEPKKIEPISFPKPEFREKAWGLNGVGEEWLVNCDEYCMKILRFAAGKSFSLHFHQKQESWYVAEGQLFMEYYDLSNADLLTKELKVGDIVHVPAGNPHRLTAITQAVVWEGSSKCYDWDSYRIGKGASQSESQ